MKQETLDNLVRDNRNAGLFRCTAAYSPISASSI